MKLTRCVVPSAIAAVLLLAATVWGQSAVTPAARVAIVGDSITEQRMYSKYMECYLLACSGVHDVKVMQFGWSGERADGFAARAENDLAGFQPTVATLCYGMNDGGYQPWKDEIGTTYEKNMRSVLAKLEAAGVKTVVVGSPGAVDTDFFRPGTKMGDRPSHEAYNDTLAHLRDIDKKLATESKQRFADVYSAMFDAIPKRQSTRAEFDGRRVGAADITTLATAAVMPGIDLVLITDRPQLDRMRDLVIAGNTAQMADAAFVRELRTWLRFSPQEAIDKGDGLFSATSGRPSPHGSVHACSI